MKKKVSTSLKLDLVKSVVGSIGPIIKCDTCVSGRVTCGSYSANGVAPAAGDPVGACMPVDLRERQ